MQRFLFWIVASIIGLILLVFVGVGAYTQTEQFHEWARTQLLATLGQSIKGEVTLERISGSLWKGITFHNLVIRQGDTEVLRVPLGTITVDLLAQVISYLRSSTVQVNTLTLQAPLLTLAQDAQGQWNITRLWQPSQPQSTQPSTVSVFVDQVQITNGHITVIPATGTASQLAPITLTGALAVRPAGTQVDLATLSFTLVHAGIPDLQWQGGITYATGDQAGRLSLHNVDLRTTQSHARISGAVQDLTTPVVDLVANVERLAVVDLQTLSPTVPLQQDLAGKIEAKGPLARLQLTVMAQATDGTVTTQVTTDLTQTPVAYEGTLTLNDVHIPQVMHLANNSGIVTGHATFVGKGTHVERGTFTATVTDLKVDRYGVGKVTTDGTIDGRKLQLTGNTDGTLGVVHWQGQLSLEQPLFYAVDLSARNVHIQQMMPQPPSVPVTINADARVQGSGTTWQELNSAIVVTLLPSRVGEITDLQGRLEGNVRSGRVTIHTLSLLSHDTTLNVQGQVAGLQENDTGTLTYTVQTDNLSPWLALLGRVGDGALRLQGKAAGTRTALQLNGSATVMNLHMANTSLQNGAFTYTARGLGGTQPQGSATALLHNLNAGLPLQTVQLRLTLSGTQPLAAQIDLNAQDAAQRSHQLQAQVRYTTELIEATVQRLAVQLPTGVWSTPQPARLAVHDQTVRVERLQLQRGRHSLMVNGIVSPRGPQDAQLQIVRLPLAEVHTLLGRGPDVTGEASATLVVRGTAAQPLINAEITTSALTIADQNLAGLAAQAVYRDARLQLSARLRQDRVNEIALAGGIPLALNWAEGNVHAVFGEADVRLSSPGLSLAILNQWSEAVRDIQGWIQVDARVQGPLSALTVSGTARLQNGQVRVPQLGIHLTELSAATVLMNDTIQVTALHASSGNGQLTGSGTFALPRETDAPITLTLRAETFQIAHTDQYRAAISGGVVASGSLQRPVISGELTVGDTVLRPELALFRSKPAPPDPTITVIRSTQAQGPPSASQDNPSVSKATALVDNNSVFERLAIDVAVKIPQNTWVYVPDGAVELRGDVRVRKAADDPLVLVGTIESVRGWYDYQGRKFRIEQGYLYFTGATPIDPSLDIVARYTLSDYRIDVVVGGTAREPQLTLRSEPALEQADILSLLVLGKTTAGLSSGEKTTLQSQALQSAARYLAKDLRQSLAKELGLDNLEFDVGRTLNQSRIGAGKYITNDVFVSTSQQLSDASNREFAVEYSISENWQIKASTTTRGNDGIDVFWRKRY